MCIMMDKPKEANKKELAETSYFFEVVNRFRTQVDISGHLNELTSTKQGFHGGQAATY